MGKVQLNLFVIGVAVIVILFILFALFVFLLLGLDDKNSYQYKCKNYCNGSYVIEGNSCVCDDGRTYDIFEDENNNNNNSNNDNEIKDDEEIKNDEEVKDNEVNVLGFYKKRRSVASFFLCLIAQFLQLVFLHYDVVLTHSPY